MGKALSRSVFTDGSHWAPPSTVTYDTTRVLTDADLIQVPTTIDIYACKYCGAAGTYSLSSVKLYPTASGSTSVSTTMSYGMSTSGTTTTTERVGSADTSSGFTLTQRSQGITVGRVGAVISYSNLNLYPAWAYIYKGTSSAGGTPTASTQISAGSGLATYSTAEVIATGGWSDTYAVRVRTLTRTLRVTVKDGSGTVISGASVFATWGTNSATGTTSSSGVATLTVAGSTAITVSATKTGYNEASSTTSASATSITLTMTAATSTATDVEFDVAASSGSGGTCAIVYCIQTGEFVYTDDSGLATMTQPFNTTYTYYISGSNNAYSTTKSVTTASEASLDVVVSLTTSSTYLTSRSITCTISNVTRIRYRNSNAATTYTVVSTTGLSSKIISAKIGSYVFFENDTQRTAKLVSSSTSSLSVTLRATTIDPPIEIPDL